LITDLTGVKYTQILQVHMYASVNNVIDTKSIKTIQGTCLHNQID